MSTIIIMSQFHVDKTERCKLMQLTHNDPCYDCNCHTPGWAISSLFKPFRSPFVIGQSRRIRRELWALERRREKSWCHWWKWGRCCYCGRLKKAKILLECAPIEEEDEENC